MTQNPHQTGAHDSSSFRAERVVEEARRLVAKDERTLGDAFRAFELLELLLASQEAAPSARAEGSAIHAVLMADARKEADAILSERDYLREEVARLKRETEHLYQLAERAKQEGSPR